MAEVATGVLHNVGNVLNSLNVSTAVITNGLRQSKTESLSKVGGMLHEHRADLATYLTQDTKGKLVLDSLNPSPSILPKTALIYCRRANRSSGMSITSRKLS